MKKFFLLILFCALNSYAQFTEFHPELDWYTIKGKHVEVHFHEGAERTARVVAKIADEEGFGDIAEVFRNIAVAEKQHENL